MKHDYYNWWGKGYSPWSVCTIVTVNRNTKEKKKKASCDCNCVQVDDSLLSCSRAIFHVMGTAVFWLCLLAVIVTAMVPRLAMKAITEYFAPSDIQIARELEKFGSLNEATVSEIPMSTFSNSQHRSRQWVLFLKFYFFFIFLFFVCILAYSFSCVSDFSPIASFSLPIQMGRFVIPGVVVHYCNPFLL